jgi:hypothetical protein
MCDKGHIPRSRTSFQFPHLHSANLRPEQAHAQKEADRFFAHLPKIATQVNRLGAMSLLRNDMLLLAARLLAK